MSNFQPLEVVGRGSETQLKVTENLNKLTSHGLPHGLTILRGPSNQHIG